MIQAGIDLDKLQEEIKTIFDFIYIKHPNEWYVYCKTNRNGRQDIEQLSKIESSILKPNPWRFFVEKKTIMGIIGGAHAAELIAKTVLEGETNTFSEHLAKEIMKSVIIKKECDVIMHMEDMNWLFI